MAEQDGVNIEESLNGINKNKEDENEEKVDEQEEKERQIQLERIKEILFGLPTNIALKLIQNKIDLKHYKIRKESIQTLCRCLSLFILYITDCALEHAEHDKRSTIQTQDILAALDESLFIDIAEELKGMLSHSNDVNENIGKTQSVITSNDLIKKKEAQQKKSDESKDDFDILLEAL